MESTLNKIDIDIDIDIDTFLAVYNIENSQREGVGVQGATI